MLSNLSFYSVQSIPIIIQYVYVHNILPLFAIGFLL